MSAKAQNVPDIFKTPEFLVYLIITHEMSWHNFSFIGEGGSPALRLKPRFLFLCRMEGKKNTFFKKFTKIFVISPFFWTYI